MIERSDAFRAGRTAKDIGRGRLIGPGHGTFSPTS
jgi:hypothetical protein